MLTHDDMLRVLESACAHGAIQWCRRHGIAPATVSDIRRRKRRISPKVLKALGYEKVIGYKIARKR